MDSPISRIMTAIQDINWTDRLEVDNHVVYCPSELVSDTLVLWTDKGGKRKKYEITIEEV